MDKSKMYADLGIREKTIGTHRFQIDLLPCGPAGEAFIELMDIVGPSIGVAIDRLRNIDYVSPEEDTTFTEIIGTLSAKIARGEINRVVDLVLKGCLIDGAPFDKNKHLRGEFETYPELIMFALEENFSSFFIGRLKAMGLEISSLKSFMELMKRRENPDITDSPSNSED